MFSGLLGLLVCLFSEPQYGSTLFSVIVHGVRPVTSDAESIAVLVLIL